jgi:hypothetical protein
MKKLLVALAAAALLPLTAFAMDHAGDGVMMKDGKMMEVKDGKTMPMDKEMTMSDGTKVMEDGTVMTKDGKKMMMKDGEHMSMDGKMGSGAMTGK